MNKLILLPIVFLLLVGCGTFGGGSDGIDVPKRMGQAQEQGDCKPAAIYEETEEGEYKKTHKFAMVCK